MTVATTQRVVRYLGNAVTTVFAFDFLIRNALDLQVFIYDSVTKVATQTTAFTVTGIGDENGGNVTMTVAPSATETVIIKRATDLLQNLDITNQDGFYPEVLEEQIDKIALQVQELSEAISRAPKLLDGESFLKTWGMKADLVNKVMSFGPDGEPALGESSFSPDDLAKLAGIEAGATADQTGAEIKVLYEAEADTNAFTDAEKVKLAGLFGDVQTITAVEVKTLYESNADTNAFTDALLTQLIALDDANFIQVAAVDQNILGIKTFLGKLQAGTPNAVFADGAQLEVRTESEGAETVQAIFSRKDFDFTGTPLNGVGHHAQFTTFQNTYNKQNVWGFSHTHTMTSVKGGALGSCATFRSVRNLEWTGTAWMLGTPTTDEVNSGQFGIHAPMEDNINYAQHGLTPGSMVNEWSMGCWNNDRTDNRILKTIAQAQAGVTKNAVFGLGSLGVRAMHTMTAWGYDQGSEIGVGIYIKPTEPAGGAGNRSWTDPETLINYPDNYGGFRYGIAINDLNSRGAGNPGIIGTGIYIANGGNSSIELYGDPKYGILMRGEYVEGAIELPNEQRLVLGRDASLNAISMRYSLAAGRLQWRQAGTSLMLLDVSNKVLEMQGPIRLQTYTVATAPASAVASLIYVSDGAAGAPCLAVRVGTSWLRVVPGAAISAT